MEWLKIKDIVSVTKGKLVCGDENIECSSFSKDTRTIEPGDIYIGIKGENFDGNLYYAEALAKGAIGCILDKSIEEKLDFSNLPTKLIVLVDNTVEALTELAKYRLSQVTIPVVAVTGSVGKTSTRDIIYSVMSQKYEALKTDGNFNNNIGLPLTILRLKDHDAAILEMGMDHLGEISELSKIAEPDIAVITNVEPVHLATLGKVENVLSAKMEIVDGLREHGVLIFNNENEYLKNASKSVPCLSYGLSSDANIYATDIEFLENGTKFSVHVAGEIIPFEMKINTIPYVLNALAAITVGLKLNIPISDIQKGIKDFELTTGRLEEIKLKDNVLLINDAYNANTASMKNAIDYLMNKKGAKKIAVLGDMLELGERSQELHENVGRYVADKEVDVLICLGQEAKYIYEAAIQNGLKNVQHFTNKEEAIKYLESEMVPNSVVIVKASNGMKFKEIVEYLKEKAGQ